ncbi:hypothetical protein M0R45_017038 [Rubus argutus]|uniref:TIR domain-containing protein n=1 Tax=Rubus argutus TaxID=59490 RepID=A0AAW1XUE1_RUBAR
MAVAASSSSWNYDVFISFRGEDTRKIFVGHLYRALEQKAIHTFIDSEVLQKGNDLSKLLNAIEDSRLSIVVFSKNYASSTWCLKELVKILECMDAQNQIVVPVFYEVDPSHVRNLKGSFAKANKEEMHSWKTAVTRAADLSGWVSRDYKDDGDLIEKIVQDTFHKLIHVSSSKPHGLVGMDYHLNEMYSLLGLGVDDVRFVVIWGMGGIGKTTIAKAVYDEIACQFDHCCFLYDVKDGFTKKGKAQILEDFLSRILKEKVSSTDVLNRGSNMIMERLGKKRVLLVLDNLDDIAQIEILLGEQHSFGRGSRVILTTRYIQSLSGIEYRLYKPKCLNYDEAHELFMKYAFRTKKPSGEYDHLSRRAIKYAQGLPLALKVLGASLYNRSVAVWEDALEKINDTPQREIEDVLRTSFDGLEPSEKNIFLDVACFFRGDNKIYATNILNTCGFFPKIGLEVLVDKALVTIEDDDTIQMHDLLVEMGRKIGRTSRLWSYEDISRVLTENTATEAVEAIKLDLWPRNGKQIYLNPEAFASMTKLRLLKIDWSGSNCTHYLGRDLKFLSHQLRVLAWRGCPLKSLPYNFQPLNLVCLSMPCSHIGQLWEGTKPLGNLKSINLSDSQCLRKIPDCSQAINLETLNLSGCTSLLEVHPSILTLTNLAFWSLKGCKTLERLPSSIYMKSLKTLILSGCSNLKKFPEISGIMKDLQELRVDETAIVELPSSINNFPGLVILSLQRCTELKRLPSSIHFKSLKSLILSYCSNLERFPDIRGIMKELPELVLDMTAIEELPSSIENLTGLVTLRLHGCRELKRLPSTIHMKSLKTLILSYCSNLVKFPEISGIMKDLSELRLDGTAIVELPLSINNLPGLVILSLQWCKELKRLPSSIHFRSLESLMLNGCSNLESFPEIRGIMKELPELCLDETAIEELPSSIENLTGLVTLSLKGCTRLKRLPNSIHLKSLKSLILYGCSKLERFPEIRGIMKELPELCLDETGIEELPSSIENLTGLVTLSLKRCTKLKRLPSSICQLKSLKYLILSGCSKFEVFPIIVEDMEELRELHLDGTSIKELSPSIERLKRLIFLNMRNCRSLVYLPDNICNLSYLTALTLSGCSNIYNLPENCGNWESLLDLDVEGSGCRVLKMFPSSICMRSLRTLDLSGCSNLDKFPEILEDMVWLSEIGLDETTIKELPSSIGRLRRLKVLSMRNCRSLVSLPESICTLAYLQELYLAGCSKLYTLPDNLRNAQALTILEVQGSGIERLSFFITNKETVREGVIRVSGNVIRLGGASGGVLGGRREFGGLKQLLELPK